MKQKITFKILAICSCLLLLVSHLSYSQCPDPRLYDINLTRAVANPVWENCIDNASDPDQYTLVLLSPNDIHNYVLDFGDGSPTVSGALWSANTPINHNYNLGIYTVSLTETNDGCTRSITGTLTNDRKAGATAIPPTIGTSGCVPHTLTFVNQSTNYSQFTRFEWNWGDGTTDMVGPSTVGKPISHVYQKGRAGCNMVVTLTAFSLCDTTFSSYGPYDFWDVDTAAVTASATRICGGQNVTFTDQTLYNCNVKQPRKIRWDFRSVGGPLTGWLPATPANRSQTYFVTGNVGDRFTIALEDSNFCGVRAAAITVEIIGPPTAAINLPLPTICAGQEGVFQNTSTGSADVFYWDFGDGSPVYSNGSKADVRHQYNNPGTYTVKQIAAISGTQLCRDTASVNITVLPSSISNFTLDNVSGCAPVTVTITESSTNAVSWNWDFGSLGTYIGQNPPPLTITQQGTYQIKLQTTNSLGCGNVKTSTINVFPDITVNAEFDSVCLGSPVFFKDKSALASGSSCATGSILYEKWNNITGSIVTDLTSKSVFPNTPSSTSLLNIFEAPLNVDDNYGARIRGFICPPQNGNYVFWISSDDDAELWLSTDASPTNKVLIAKVNGYTNSREWNKFSSQQSVPVFLSANTKYYIEALHKEGTGGDNLAVGWQLPSGTRERPIPGVYLSPFSEGSTIQTWHWDFGDGKSSNLQNVNYTYANAGTYNVQFTASTGKCSKSITLPVLVAPATTANFSQSDTAACTPFGVDFINLSKGASKLNWDFGDGSAAENYNDGEKDTLHHVFVNNTGVNQSYYINLIATNAAGCSDTSIRKVTVYPGPKADFNFSPATPKCSPVTVKFNNLSAAASSYKWFFGDYDNSNTNNKSFDYNFVNKTGTIRFDTIRLQAISSTGCYGEATQIVTIFPEADFTISAMPDNACHPANIQFSAAGGPVSYQWNFGDGVSSMLPSPGHTYLNTDTKDSVYEVGFIGTSPFGCKDTTSMKVTVHPSPQADFTANNTIGCSPLKVDFGDLSANKFASVWDYGDGKKDSIKTNAVSHTFINTSNTVKIYNVQLLVYSKSGCTSLKSIPVTVYPEIKAAFTVDVNEGCSPVKVAFTNSSIGASTYTWDFGDGLSSVNSSPTHTFTYNGTKDTTYNIEFQILSSFGCKDSVSGSVKVNSVPVAQFIPDATVGCTPFTVTFNNLSQNAVSSNWAYGDGNVESNISASHKYTFFNNTSAVKKYPVQLEVSSASGCKAIVSKEITVNPGVDALYNTNILGGCSPLKVGFNNMSTGATSYNWNFGDGSSSSSSNPEHVFTNGGVKDTIYTVSLEAISTFGCRDTMSQVVNVYSLPSTQFISDINAGCTPLKVNFTDLSTNAKYRIWNYGDGNVDTLNNGTHSHTFINSESIAKTYQVKLDVQTSNGCTITQIKPITVYPAVKATFSLSTIQGCSPLNVAFSNSSQGATSYSWSFGDGSSSTDMTPVHTFKNDSDKDSTFPIVLTIASSYGCKDTAKASSLVYALPKADFLQNITAGCSPLNIEFTNLSLRADNISWNFGDGNTSSTDLSIIHYNYLNQSGIVRNFPIELTVSTNKGCTDSKKSTVSVYPEVSAYFIANDTINCTPLNVKFTNLSYGASVYSWSFGDGGSSSEKYPVHSFTNNTDKDVIYPVELKITSGYNCSSQYSQNITVHPNPQASFVGTPVSGCSPLKVGFVNNSQGAVKYNWNFGEGIDQENNALGFDKVFENNTPAEREFMVNLTAISKDGCTNTVGSPVKVYPSVQSGFTTSDTAGCSPLKVSFYNLSTNAGSYIWKYGNGDQSLNTNPSYTFLNTSNERDTTYTVTLISSNSYGCIDTSYKNISVYARPEAEFTSDNPTGCSPHTVKVTNTSKGGSVYNWNYGDGKTSTSFDGGISHLFENTSALIANYPVSLTVSTDKGCEDTQTAGVVVYPEVKASFISDPSGCSPFTVKLINNGTNGSLYTWEFGDGKFSTELNPTHTYENIKSVDSTFNISLVSRSSYGCSDTISNMVTVFSRPKARFSANPLVIQLPDSVVNIVNQSSPGNWDYSWDFADKSTSKERDPLVHYFNFYGEYKIRLIATGANCSDTTYQTVIVKPTKPIAAFTGNAEGCTPTIVQFANTSKYADQFFWDFGDGETSTLKNPKHTYDVEGTYTVSLKVTGEGGEDKIIKEDIIKVYPIPSAFFKVKPESKVVKIPGNSHYFANLSEGATYYQWTFGDGSTSSEKNPYHAYTQPGTYDVSLTVTNSYGCTSVYAETSAAIAEGGGKIKMPNAFTPGVAEGAGDGKNDVFVPVSEGVVEFQMQIFNRWGELIYETKQITKGWDGTYRGEPCKQDVYVYKYKAKFIDGTIVEDAGDVTLIR